MHRYSLQMTDLIKVCSKIGATVAEIREEKANSAALAIRQEFTFVIGSGNDEAEEGKWVWASDGQLFKEIDKEDEFVIISNSYQKFGADWPKWDETANCLVMVLGLGNPAVAGTWQSKPCKTGKRVLCEAKVVSGKTIFL